MIAEITKIVHLVFKDSKHSDSTDCIENIFDLFADNINNNELIYTVFTEKLFYIFLEYAPYIKPYYWQSIITVNINKIPLDDLWDVYQKELKKHS